MYLLMTCPVYLGLNTLQLSTYVDQILNDTSSFEFHGSVMNYYNFF